MDKLNRVREGWYEYRRLQERVETLEAVAEKTTVSLTGMPRGGGDGSTAGDVWALLIDYRTELEVTLKQYLIDCRELEKELDNTIRSPRIRTAMKYRYIDCLKNEDIAHLMDCEPRNVYYLLQKGKKIYEGSTYNV